MSNKYNVKIENTIVFNESLNLESLISFNVSIQTLILEKES